MSFILKGVKEKKISKLYFDIMFFEYNGYYVFLYYGGFYGFFFFLLLWGIYVFYWVLLFNGWIILVLFFVYEI